MFKLDCYNIFVNMNKLLTGKFYGLKMELSEYSVNYMQKWGLESAVYAGSREAL